MPSANEHDELPPPPPSVISYIGTAYMDEKGTIELKLRAEEEGKIGSCILTYPKGHPDYVSILSHLNGLSRGEHKPVRPWAETDK